MAKTRDRQTRAKTDRADSAQREDPITKEAKKK